MSIRDLFDASDSDEGHKLKEPSEWTDSVKAEGYTVKIEKEDNTEDEQVEANTGNHTFGAERPPELRKTVNPRTTKGDVMFGVDQEEVEENKNAKGGLIIPASRLVKKEGNGDMESARSKYVKRLAENLEIREKESELVKERNLLKERE